MIAGADALAFAAPVELYQTLPSPVAGGCVAIANATSFGIVGLKSSLEAARSREPVGSLRVDVPLRVLRVLR